jgi:hypothetical protein
MPGRAGLSGFILGLYFSILSIPPARAKLFREAWLILSEKDRFALHSLFFKSTEYIIRCWTFDVQCSTFIFLLTPRQGLPFLEDVHDDKDEQENNDNNPFKFRSINDDIITIAFHFNHNGSGETG